MFLFIAVSFQNSLIQPQSEIVCTAGVSAIMEVTVCNQSAQALKNLELTLKFYQDYLNGIENYNLETRVALSGQNRLVTNCGFFILISLKLKLYTNFDHKGVNYEN